MIQFDGRCDTERVVWLACDVIKSMGMTTTLTARLCGNKRNLLKSYQMLKLVDVVSLITSNAICRPNSFY